MSSITAHNLLAMVCESLSGNTRQLISLIKTLGKNGIKYDKKAAIFFSYDAAGYIFFSVCYYTTINTIVTIIITDSMFNKL